MTRFDTRFISRAHPPADPITYITGRRKSGFRAFTPIVAPLGKTTGYMDDREPRALGPLMVGVLWRHVLLSSILYVLSLFLHIHSIVVNSNYFFAL
jgi:hypothetical protein